MIQYSDSLLAIYMHTFFEANLSGLFQWWCTSIMNAVYMVCYTMWFSYFNDTSHLALDSVTGCKSYQLWPLAHISIVTSVYEHALNNDDFNLLSYIYYRIMSLVLNMLALFWNKKWRALGLIPLRLRCKKVMVGSVNFKACFHTHILVCLYACACMCVYLHAHILARVDCKDHYSW